MFFAYIVYIYTPQRSHTNAHTYQVTKAPQDIKTSKTIYFACGCEVQGGVGESSLVDGGGVTSRRRRAALGGISSAHYGRGRRSFEQHAMFGTGSLDTEKPGLIKRHQ